jgi:hypothetical protein
VERLSKGAVEAIEAASRLPQGATYTIDEEANEVGADAGVGPVEKTRIRTLVSARFGVLRVREVVRKGKGERDGLGRRPWKLTRLAPSGATHAFDLIARVGQETFLEGRTLAEVQATLANQRPYLALRPSTLYDLKLKFLFYLGEMHRWAGPRLRDYLQSRGSVVWLMDGTLEPGTPTFFGVEDAVDGLLLGSWKLPTENEEDVARCLREAARDFGPPQRVLHDLSQILGRACEKAFEEVPHSVCHFHLGKVIGNDLYEAPQAALMREVRSSQLQLRLKDQRSKQTQRLKEELRDPKVRLVLHDLLRHRDSKVEWTETLGREVLIAFHLWISDYPSDGHRQGFPFDPHLLYFHRRVVRTKAAFDHLLSHEAVQRCAPLRVFHAFSKKIDAYLDNPKVLCAAQHYETAFRIFEEVRTALRLTARGRSPLHDPYLLESGQEKEILLSLLELRAEFNQRARSGLDSHETKLYETALRHLDTYMPLLHKESDAAPGIRTTNGLEGGWGKGKQALRKVHGRRRLTRDFDAMPAQYMLLLNLMRPVYIDLVLGSLENLPDKLAEAGASAPPFSHWLRERKKENVARLSKTILRDPRFPERLVEIYTRHCVEAAMN